MSTVLMWLAVLAACGPSPSPSTVTPTARPIPSPTPSLTVSLEAWHIDPTSRHVLGVVSVASGPPSTDVVLEVSLLDAHGEAVGKSAVPLLNTYLIPSGRGLFAADFPAAPPGSILRVHVLSHTPEVGEILPLEASVLEADWEAGPAVAVLGRLTNPHDRPMHLDDLWVVGMDSTGQPRTAARGAAGAEVLAPGGSVPFRADTLGSAGVMRWVVLAQGSPRDLADAAAVHVEALGLKVDPQGRSFATGWLVNPSDRPRVAHLVLLATAGDEWLSAGVFEFPVPLPPGAMWPFSVDNFPGLADRKPEGEDVLPMDLVPFVVDAPSPLVLDDLTPEVTGFEVIGSRLYLRGIVRNAGAAAVDQPSLLAWVQSSEGDLVTAGWAQPADRLRPGEAVSFLLTAPVPDGVDLSLAEYVVQAFGTRR